MVAKAVCASRGRFATGLPVTSQSSALIMTADEKGLTVCVGWSDTRETVSPYFAWRAV